MYKTGKKLEIIYHLKNAHISCHFFSFGRFSNTQEYNISTSRVDVLCIVEDEILATVFPEKPSEKGGGLFPMAL